MFITFEGGEGSGKSTQCRLLFRKLMQQKVPAVLTHEPGGTALGNQIRRILKKNHRLSREAELLLFAACRAQLVSEIIYPALQQGKVVICDRFSYSTIAYQGYGRGIKPEVIKLLNDIATRELSSDLVVLLDISPEQGLSRKRSRKDRFELEDLDFHRRVREGYLKMAATDPVRWLVIDACLPRGKIAEIVWDKVSQLLARPPSSLAV